MSDEPENSAMDEFRKGKQDVREQLGISESSQPSADVSDERLQEIVHQAKNDTVTAKRLIGKEQFFHDVLPFIESDEQPHFLLPLTKGILADPALVIESGAEREELLDKQDGGSVVITNKYVRIHSDKGEWTIPYSSISSVDFVGHPALHIQSVGRTYYIKIAGTHFDEEENLSVAAKYIRQKQQEAEGNSSDSNDSADPLDQLEKLNNLKEAGALTEKEFEHKKQNLLDEI